MNTLLQFSDVHLQYQNGQNLTEVIKGISFTINQNERLAIVGKSDQENFIDVNGRFRKTYIW